MLLCAFLWCSNNITKKSSSFYISPTSVIIFKCRNREHMKNNIRYKGNINNTSVIIFFKSKVKNSQRCYFAWENLRGGFCDVSCSSSFHYWSSFCCCIFICRFSLFTFSFRRHPSQGFYTHFIISAQPIAEWSVTLSFSTIPLSSCRKRCGLEWGFFTHKRFLPYAPLPTF